MKIAITNRSAVSSIFCIALILLFSVINLAQNVQYPETKVDMMERGNARIDPLTGALSFSLPIKVYAGRGGTSIPISFNYSSKVWQMDYEYTLDNTNCDYGPNFCTLGPITIISPRFAAESSSGWTTSRQMPKIKSDEQVFDAQGKYCTSGSCLSNPYHIERLFIEMPDGSSHEFRKNDGIHQGFSATFGTFYSVDGSGIRFEWSNQNSTLFLPDGSRYIWEESNNQYSTKYVDRYGNTIRNESNGWRDTLGRLIPSPPIGDQAPATGDYNYTIPGFGTSTQTYVFKWRKLEDVRTDPNQPLRYTGDRNQTYNFYNPALFTGDEANRFSTAALVHNPVVLNEIVLPDGRSYKFTYNVYGEIDKIVHPTGAYERFSHDYIQPTQFLSAPYDQANRGVGGHWISPTGNAADEQAWGYSRNSITQTTSYALITQPDGTAIKKYFQKGRDFQDSTRIYGFDEATAGKEYEERVIAPGNVIKRRALSKWEQLGPVNIGGVTGHSAARRDPYLSKQISIIFETSNTEHALMQMTEYEYGTNTDLGYLAHLNPIRTKQHKYVVIAKSTAETADFGTLVNSFNSQTVERITETDYLTDANYKARNMNSLPQETRILNQAGTVVAKTQILYDESGYSLASTGTMPTNAANSWIDPQTELGTTIGSKRGLPTTVRSFTDVANNQYIETHTFYDQYGNVRKTRDGRNIESEIQYDDDYAFAYPTKTISAVPDTNGTYGSSAAFTSEMTYDFNSGLPLTSKDANNQISTIEYNDVLLRPTKTIAPNGHQTITEYGAGTSETTRFVKVRSQIDETNWSEGYSWYDGLGRTVKSQSVDSNGDVFTETIYDNMSRPKKATNPYRTGETKLWTESFYDDLGRATKIKTPDNAEVLTSYDLATTGANIGTVVVVKDQALKERRSITNALGQLMRVDEPNDSNQLGAINAPNQPTNYAYDILNNLTQVQQIGTTTQQCGGTSSSCTQTRSFVYDSLSRLKQAIIPESGTINYNYDNNGNLTSKTDARGITTTYSYDALNRVKTRNYNDNITPSVSYKYDLLTNAKGKLIEVDNTISKTKYLSFDIMGRVTSSQQITDGTTYNPMTYTYNLSGALIEETYPSGRVVKNSYDIDGDLMQVQSKKVNETFKNYANSFNYTAAGAISSIRLGNGRWENTQFNSRLQPTQIGLGTSATNQSLLKLNYNYGSTDNNGNVKSQTITVQRSNQSPLVLTQSYEYDSLNRLQSAEEKDSADQMIWKQSYTFDRFGNRRFTQENTTLPTFSNTNITNPTIDPTNNRFTTGQGYIYDLAGNLLTDAEGRTFTYDAENKQKTAANTGGTIGQYFYDGDGKRVKKVSVVETVIFVYDVNGKLVAEYSTQISQTPQVQYLTNDHLGSPRINTNELGVVVSRSDYLPYGEEIIGIGNRTSAEKYVSDDVRKEFTLKERDSETKLDYFLARYYSSSKGRFTSPDPLFIAPQRQLNPQTLNLYTYVTNNPLTYTDPTGMERIKLGRSQEEIHSDITEVDSQLGQENITEDQRKELQNRRNNLVMEQRANLIVSGWLAELRMAGLDKGLQLSDFSIMTDFNNDLRQLAQEGVLDKNEVETEIINNQIDKVTVDAVTINGATYINTAANTTFGLSFSASGFDGAQGIGVMIDNRPVNITQSDVAKVGGALLIHERKHQKGENSESKAYGEQLKILEKFGPTFSSPAVYNTFRDTVVKSRDIALERERRKK